MTKRELMKKTDRAQAGFTLIELMIVIAIIGILAAVAIPNFLRARDQAKYTSCLDSLSAVKVAEEMYIIDMNSYTQTSDYLVMYMTATCTDPAGAGAGCVDAGGKNLVDARISNTNCAPTWAIDTTSGTFVISGTARDKNTCHICVGSSGYRPDKFADCPTYKAGFHADCPNL